MADLGRRHGHSAQLLGDRFHLAGRNTLHVHFSHRQQQSPFTPQALFQRFRVEAPFAYLWDRECNAAYPGLHRLRLIAVGVPLPLLTMLVRFCFQVLLPFCLHRCIEDHLDQFRQYV